MTAQASYKHKILTTSWSIVHRRQQYGEFFKTKNSSDIYVTIRSLNYQNSDFGQQQQKITMMKWCHQSGSTETWCDHCSHYPVPGTADIKLNKICEKMERGNTEVQAHKGVNSVGRFSNTETLPLQGPSSPKSKCKCYQYWNIFIWLAMSKRGMP